jgi:hypothetical protein
MKSILRLLTLITILAWSQTALASVSVSPISDTTVRAGETRTINIVAVDPDGNAITVVAAVPAFGTVSGPTTGPGQVVTSVILAPLDADIGTHNSSVTALTGSDSDTEEFKIIVVAADANSPPHVTTFALRSASETATLQFEVTANDAEGDTINSLTAVGLPAGATFTPNSNNTSGEFSWTPTLDQAGHYDVIFVAANAQVDSATTHIIIFQTSAGPVTLAPIDNVTLVEGDSTTVNVLAIDPDKEPIKLTASLPAFATLEQPDSSTDAESLSTMISIKPGAGTAGTYDASVTAASGGDTATEPFTITVTAPVPTGLEAVASLIGAYNVHKKFLCFKVVPVDNSFNLLDVSLHSVVLTYHGISISNVRPTHLAFDCDEVGDGEHEGDDDQGDCDECEDGGDGGHDGENDAAAADSDSCAASHIMACFSMHDIQTLFAGAALPDSFAAATIEGELNTGGTFVATIGGKHVTDDKGNHGEGNGDKNKPKGKLEVRVRPNPMNPRADISFTLAEAGRVRIAIYDLSGRLIKTVQEGNFPAGANTVSWSGSTGTGSRAASGVYFVKVETAKQTEVQRVTVVK